MKIAVILGLFVATSAWAHDHCATVYQYSNFGGSSLEINSGADISNLAEWTYYDYDRGYERNWDNKISSIVVEEGCSLVGYQYQNFGRNYYSGRRMGWSQAWSADCNGGDQYYGDLGWADNKISSLTCYCDNRR